MVLIAGRVLSFGKIWMHQSGQDMEGFIVFRKQRRRQ
jgi:hypothetical protein